jgi:transposase
MNEKLESIIRQHMEAAGLKYHPPGQRTVLTEQEQAIEEIARWFKLHPEPK